MTASKKLQTLALGLFVLTFSAQKLDAQTKPSQKQTYSYTSEVDFKNPQGTHHLHGSLGIFGGEGGWIHESDTKSVSIGGVSGIIALGADYEYMYKSDMGLGAQVKYFTTSDQPDANNNDYKLTAFHVTGYARFHIPHNNFDIYFAPGIGFTSASAELKPKSGDATKASGGLVLTPSYQLGVFYAINPKTAIGMETQRIIFVGETNNGWLLSDYILKLRYSL